MSNVLYVVVGDSEKDLGTIRYWSSMGWVKDISNGIKIYKDLRWALRGVDRISKKTLARKEYLKIQGYSRNSWLVNNIRIQGIEILNLGDFSEEDLT